MGLEAGLKSSLRKPYWEWLRGQNTKLPGPLKGGYFILIFNGTCIFWLGDVSRFAASLRLQNSKLNMKNVSYQIRNWLQKAGFEIIIIF